MRLASGQRFRATLIEVRDEAVLMLPKTRVPVPIQPVPYREIVALEVDPARDGRRQGCGHWRGHGCRHGLRDSSDSLCDSWTTSGLYRLNEDQIAERGARMARRHAPRIPGVFEGGATQPAGMPRPRGGP